MSRLSPWISRKEMVTGNGRSAGRRLVAGSAQAIAVSLPLAASPQWLDDLQFFFAGWAGGLVFFLTLLG